MALINFVETDTSATFNVGCSGQTAGATTDGRQANSGGSAGVTEVSVDPGNNVTRACFVFLCSKPGASASWNSGTWTIPVNHTTMDGGTQLTRVDVCDFLSGTGYTSIANTTSPGHTRGNTGVLNVSVTQGSNHTPQDATDSQPFIVLTYNNNDAHGASGLGITPSETINSPIDDGGAATTVKMEAMGVYRSW